MKTDARWVKPQYRNRRGFTRSDSPQVDVDGKSGLIDRDGKMIIEPKYGFVRAIGPDRLRCIGTPARWRLMGSETSLVGGRISPSGGILIGPIFSGIGDPDTGVIDSTGPLDRTAGAGHLPRIRTRTTPRSAGSKQQIVGLAAFGRKLPHRAEVRAGRQSQ